MIASVERNRVMCWKVLLANEARAGFGSLFRIPTISIGIKMKHNMYIILTNLNRHTLSAIR